MRLDPPSIPATEPVGGRAGIGAGWWTAVLSALAVVGLVGLALLLLLMDVLASGAAAVLSPGVEDVGPDAQEYVEAVVLGAGVALLGSAVLLGLGRRTPLRSWPAAAQGLTVSIIAGLAGGSALLLRLGIDPLGFVVTLL